MRAQSILRQFRPIPGFVYGSVELRRRGQKRVFYVRLKPRSGSRPVCSGCGTKRRGYDRLAERQFDFVPLWAMPVVFLYAMRRVDCARCGVVVEMVPWATGKSPLTHAYCWFLSKLVQDPILEGDGAPISHDVGHRLSRRGARSTLGARAQKPRWDPLDRRRRAVVEEGAQVPDHGLPTGPWVPPAAAHL